MIAKILLPLLLVASAVADDAVTELCQQLTSQVNNLQNLAPLEFDVDFRKTPLFSNDFIYGPAKFRQVSTFYKANCFSSHEDRVYRVYLDFIGHTAFIISPSTVVVLKQPSYSLTLEVGKSDDESKKTVTVTYFKFSALTGTEGINYITEKQLNYINSALTDILKKKIQHDLRTTFKTDTRVEISNKLIQDLMINIFQVTAQDF